MSHNLSDLEIARAARPLPITNIAGGLGIPQANLIPYGHDKAKINYDYLQSLSDKPDGKLILVTAISPTPAGEGKTTTTVGLGDGLNRIGKKTIICLREPSLGPCFGMKGGAAGGGYAQVATSHGEGKCGADKKADGEGSCGEKMKEGSCGEKAKEGSCGEKAKEGSCGEKAKEGSCGEKKAGEGKCGEGKCGGS